MVRAVVRLLHRECLRRIERLHRQRACCRHIDEIEPPGRCVVVLQVNAAAAGVAIRHAELCEKLPAVRGGGGVVRRVEVGAVSLADGGRGVIIHRPRVQTGSAVRGESADRPAGAASGPADRGWIGRRGVCARIVKRDGIGLCTDRPSQQSCKQG